jgi:hypothetical protein
VEAIANPPRSERLREWGYLAAIAIVAIGIGAGALWLGNTFGMDTPSDPGTTIEVTQEAMPGH